MLFNSIDFAIFLPIVFAIYWRLVKNVKVQNLFLLSASYFFYGWWNWRYLSLVLFCSIVNYAAGLLMMKTDEKKQRKIILTVCCLVSLGVLGVFKYYDFFVISFVDAFSLIGIQLHAHTLQLILPIGISFYTFHTLSYTIDVYRKKFEPTKDVVSFFLFVSIFPLAMAGPIERAGNLLPQIYKRRTFDYGLAVDGMRQILWGLFKKMVIADNCAVIVNTVFENDQSLSGNTLALGLVFFAFQLYSDFSGYSDMALGIGKLFGFKFSQNFNYPYFATTFADFWKRNHISLTQWFMDYVYYPLVGSSAKLWYWNLCMIITFLLSGLWHGANWTFVLWGLYQGIFIVISMKLGKSRKRFEKKHNLKNNTVYQFLSMFLTFGIVCFGLVFFRAESISDAWNYISCMFSSSTLHLSLGGFNRWKIMFATIGIVILLITEWINRKKKFGLDLSIKNRIFRWVFYILIIVIIVEMGGSQEDFIYFQF
ncbi:Peptidoglycan O-acetyltransferase [termite gut metagenome]|uniref:Peptidoglycan O-acetyltransferase n=1 Tax=termite gut metagenome TaxID=433724 RepID=A0A5J4SQB9_9ZZZZ